jgi:ABC-type bacteriocin/lantibiotic exporter with double-glycine peptidase domain
MLLDYYQRPVPYPRLLSLLHIGPIGAPRRNILRLSALGLDVVYHETTLPMLARDLRQRHPVIAFVDTAELPYWHFASNHAIVVIGVTPEQVIVNDPAFNTAPHTISHGDFGLAWLNCDNACAVVMPE